VSLKNALKKLLSITAACCIILTNVSYAFTDLTSEHWAYDAVGKMVDRKVLSGYNDGTFKPDSKITRAEFATILVKTLGIKEVSESIEFKDVEGIHWAEAYIDLANTFLTGYLLNGEYYFKPEEAALREDAAVAIVSAKGLTNKDVDIGVLNKFNDKSSISENLRKYVAIAVDNGLMKGNANGTFNPQGNLTRAEVAALFNNIYEYEKIVVNDVIESEKEEEKHIHKEVKRIYDNENGTHRVEVYCSECKEGISSKNENHKYKQGKCECGKYQLEVDVEIDETYEVGDKVYFYTYGAEKVEYSLVEDTGKTYLSEGNDNLDKKEKISIEVEEDMAGRTFILNVKAYSGNTSVKESKRFSINKNEEETEKDKLPEFEINEEDFSINLGKDYEKYQVSYCIGNTPSNWYTPSTSSVGSIPVNKDGKILLAEMRKSFGYNIFIKLKGESEYRKIEIPVGYPKGYKGCEHSWRNLVDTIEVSSDLKTIEHEKECVICGLKKKCSGKTWFYNNKTGETHDVYCLNDWCGRVLNKEKHNFENGICKACKAKEVSVETLPDFELNEEEKSIYLGENWDKYQIAYSNTNPYKDGHGTWYGPFSSTIIKDKKILIEDMPWQNAVKRCKYIHIREKNNPDLGVKTVELPKYMVKVSSNEKCSIDGNGYYWPGDEVEIIVGIDEDEILRTFSELKNIASKDIEFSCEDDKIYLRFTMPKKDVKFKVIVDKVEEPFDIYGLDGEDKIRDVVELGIMNCYEDGDFKPEQSFTRAEMAVVICKLLDISIVSISENQNVNSKYDDVKAGEWYTGYVNVLHGKGKLEYFAAQPNFRPKDNVTLDEVYTIVINALNRTEEVEDSFSKYAKSIGLNDDVNGSLANRKNIAIILSNALDIPVLEVKSTDFETGEVTLEEGDTLREIYF